MQACISYYINGISYNINVPCGGGQQWYRWFPPSCDSVGRAAAEDFSALLMATRRGLLLYRQNLGLGL